MDQKNSQICNFLARGREIQNGDMHLQKHVLSLTFNYYVYTHK
jgi:hypothetical protein